MKEILILMVLGVMLSSLSEAQKIPPQNWTFANYPSPKTQGDLCGGGRDDVMYVCDPNQILDQNQAKQLEGLIRDAMKRTVCPCARSVCDQKDSTGYRMSVALLRKMDLPPTNDQSVGAKMQDKLDYATDFARILLKRWDIGRCKEDLLIFYSMFDNVLFVETGKETSQLLKSDTVAEILLTVRYKFTVSGDKFMGLKKMIDDFIAVFNGDYESPEHKVVTPKYEAVVSSSTSITTFTLMTLTMTLLAALF